MAAPRRRWGWRSLGGKLFVSYLVVIVVSIVTLLLIARFVAFTFFISQMGHMGSGEMMPPFMRPGGAPDPELASAFRTVLTRVLLVAAGVAALIAAGASLVVTARLVGPIRRLVAASQRLAAGHYAERVPPGPDDELGDLAASFNELAASLEATERRRLELIGDVAHELRTPVATLEGYLEGLLDGVVAPSERTWAKLHDEAGRLRRLIDDLQDLSRAEAKQIPLHPAAVAPGELVRSAVERLAGQFEEKGLALTSEVADRLPPVWADRDRAVQVLTNLLVNALRYTPSPGSVRVAARPGGDAVRFVVSDTGIGIAAEHLPHLFERFYRVDKSRGRALGGSGVGLAIARALVETMGGRIWAESPGPGQGACFSFTLPAAR